MILVTFAFFLLLRSSNELPTKPNSHDVEIPPCSNGYCALSSQLIPLNSTQGYKLLMDGKQHAFFQLINNFETQNDPVVCGIATASTVLNSMHLEKPETYCYGQFCFRMFSQNYLAETNPCSKEVVNRFLPEIIGLELYQLAEIFNCFGLSTKLYYSNGTSYEEYMELFKLTFAPNAFVIVNYRRGNVYQYPPNGGHLSPLAAYNVKESRVLILDVSRYKYPPVWVEASDMVAAMNTTSSENSPRGLLIVYGPGYSSDPYPSASLLSGGDVLNKRMDIIVFLFAAAFFNIVMA